MWEPLAMSAERCPSPQVPSVEGSRSPRVLSVPPPINHREMATTGGAALDVEMEVA